MYTIYYIYTYMLLCAAIYSVCILYTHMHVLKLTNTCKGTHMLTCAHQTKTYFQKAPSHLYLCH